MSGGKRPPSPSFDDFDDPDVGDDIWASIPIPTKKQCVEKSFPPIHGLWYEVFSPKKSQDVVGQMEARKRIQDYFNAFLTEKGLKSVQQPVVPPTPFPHPFSSHKKAPISKKPGLMLVGPPGIGKTLLATLISKEYGFEPVVLDSLENRSKKFMEDSVKPSTKSTSVVSFFEKDKIAKARREIATTSSSPIGIVYSFPGTSAPVDCFFLCMCVHSPSSNPNPNPPKPRQEDCHHHG